MWLPKFIRKRRIQRFKTITTLHKSKQLKTLPIVLLKPKTSIDRRTTIIEKHIEKSTSIYHQINLHMIHHTNYHMVHTNPKLTFIQHKMIPSNKIRTLYRLAMVKLKPDFHPLIQKGLLEEKNYYKHHPSLAKKLVHSFLKEHMGDEFIKGKPLHRKQHMPFLDAFIVPAITKEDKIAMVHKQAIKEEARQEEIQTITHIEYQKIIEEVYEKVERKFKKQRERRGR